MTGHELARYLLKLPDLPVVMNGWGSDEGFEREVTGAARPDWRKEIDENTDILILGYHRDGKWQLRSPRLEGKDA